MSGHSNCGDSPHRCCVTPLLGRIGCYGLSPLCQRCREHAPSKVPPPAGELDSHLPRGILHDPQESVPRTGSLAVQPVFAHFSQQYSPCYLNIGSNRPHLASRTVLRCSQKQLISGFHHSTKSVVVNVLNILPYILLTLAKKNSKSPPPDRTEYHRMYLA